MKLPREPIVIQSPPGAFRRWLKSDMRIMRWVFLVLYVAVVATCLVELFTSDETVFIVFALIMIASQAVFILGAGRISLCHPIRRHRLLMPVIAAALMVVLLVTGLCMAMAELFYINFTDNLTFIFFGVMAISWIGWSFLLYAHVRDQPRYRAIGRLANYLLAGSLAELLATVPAHLIVTRRPGCFVGLATMLGIIAGISVMLFAFGPMILLLFLRPKFRAEMKDGIPHCINCGYDLRATPNRCPECGLLISPETTT